MSLTGARVVGGAGSLLADLLGAAAVQLPAVAVLGAATLAAVTMAPRWATGISWGLLVASIVVGPMFGPSLGLPSWLMNLSPFTHVPNAPVVTVTLAPVLGLAGAVAVLAVGSALALRHRNLALPA
jgi:ABC-2 type transport system permease protein